MCRGGNVGKVVLAAGGVWGVCGGQGGRVQVGVPRKAGSVVGACKNGSNKVRVVRGQRNKTSGTATKAGQQNHQNQV